MRIRMKAPRCSSQAGMSLIEVMVSVVVLVVAVGTSLGSMTTFNDLAESDRELAIAYTEAERAIEKIRNEDFANIFATYNQDSGDDPPGADAGPSFDVEGLEGHDGGSAGSIVFPVDPDDSGYLREDLVLPLLGLPRDLNGDGVIDSANHATDHIILPMFVRLDWTGASGNRSIQLPVYLYNNK